MKASLFMLVGIAGVACGVYFADELGFGGMADVPEGTPPIVVAFHDQLTLEGVDTVVRPVKNESSNVQRRYMFEQKSDDDRFYLLIAGTAEGAKAEVRSLQASSTSVKAIAKDKLALYLVDTPDSGDRLDGKVRDFFTAFKFNAGVEDPHKARLVY